MTRIAVVLLTMLLVGCAAPWADDAAPEATALDRRLAGRPTEPPTSVTTARGPAATSDGPDASGGGGESPGSDGGGAAGGSGEVGSPRRLAHQLDATGDAGVGAPAYADLVDVALVDTGSGLRVTIGAAGSIPRSLGDREAAGIGVDLYVREGGTESDYQIFLEGSSDGWFAYLETPAGLEQFVGTFELADTRFVVTVPWGALDDHRSGRVSVFADASSAVVAVAVASEDHAPDGGAIPFG